MDKYQPEGRYRRVSTKEEMYKKVLRATGAFALIPEAMTGNSSWPSK